MLITIGDEYWLSFVLVSCPHTLGIQPIKGSFGTTFKVTDKELFLLSVIQHGIEYKKICDLPPYTKQ
jgi:hypothetical protein